MKVAYPQPFAINCSCQVDRERSRRRLSRRHTSAQSSHHLGIVGELQDDRDRAGRFGRRGQGQLNVYRNESDRTSYRRDPGAVGDTGTPPTFSVTVLVTSHFTRGVFAGSRP